MPQATVPALRGRRSWTCWRTAGLVESKSAARRAVKEGGAYLNNVKITDEAYVPAAADLLHGRFLVLRRGKRSRRRRGRRTDGCVGRRPGMRGLRYVG